MSSFTHNHSPRIIGQYNVLCLIKTVFWRISFFPSFFLGDKLFDHFVCLVNWHSLKCCGAHHGLGEGNCSVP